MNTLLKTASLAVVMGIGATGTAAAEGEFSGNVTLTSDYVWRGISQSNEDLAIQGGFDYANGMFYAGTWASSIDFEDGSDSNVELDLYGGLAGEFEGGVAWDVGVIGYLYPDSDAEDLDFVELYGGLGYAFEGGVEVGGYAYFDPDNENLYVEGTAGLGLTDNLSADVSIGNYSFDEGEDYTAYSIGGTLSVEGFDLDLRYWGTDIDDVDIADERIVLSISRAM
ncbi:MAG: TorF family putative porin [Pseudomonadota bacterium]